MRDREDIENTRSPCSVRPSAANGCSTAAWAGVRSRFFCVLFGVTRFDFNEYFNHLGAPVEYYGVTRWLKDQGLPSRKGRERKRCSRSSGIKMSVAWKRKSARPAGDRQSAMKTRTSLVSSPVRSLSPSNGSGLGMMTNDDACQQEGSQPQRPKDHWFSAFEGTASVAWSSSFSRFTERLLHAPQSFTLKGIPCAAASGNRRGLSERYATHHTRGPDGQRGCVGPFCLWVSSPGARFHSSCGSSAGVTVGIRIPFRVVTYLEGEKLWLMVEPNEVLMPMTESILMSPMNSDTGARNSLATRCS